MTFEVAVDIKDFRDRPIAIVKLPGIYRVLSSTIMGGGFINTDTIFIMEVPLGYDGAVPEDDLMAACREFGLRERCVGFMTAADVRRVITVTKEECNGIHAITVATAGVTNAVVAGERLPQELIDTLPKHKAGTINIITLLDSPLQDCGLANGIITMTEAKGAALRDTGTPGTGTTSDAVAIASPIGAGSKYAGTASDAGIAIARSVRSAVGAAIRKWNNGNGKKAIDALTRLDQMGIGAEEMWAAAYSLHASDLPQETSMVKARFMHYLAVLRRDVNVNAILSAAISNEEMAKRDELYGLQQGRSGWHADHLVADELLGITLAEYIAGTRGLFEYARYDEKRPGILASLGPFLDDIIASLIGGIMSRVYTEQLEGEATLQS